MTKRPATKGRDSTATKNRRSLHVSDGFRSFVPDQLESQIDLVEWAQKAVNVARRRAGV
jgi:hypothetical protein